MDLHEQVNIEAQDKGMDLELEHEIKSEDEDSTCK